MPCYRRVLVRPGHLAEVAGAGRRPAPRPLAPFFLPPPSLISCRQRGVLWSPNLPLWSPVGAFCGPHERSTLGWWPCRRVSAPFSDPSVSLCALESGGGDTGRRARESGLGAPATLSAAAFGGRSALLRCSSPPARQHGASGRQTVAVVVLGAGRPGHARLSSFLPPLAKHPGSPGRPRLRLPQRSSVAPPLSRTLCCPLVVAAMVAVRTPRSLLVGVLLSAGLLLVGSSSATAWKASSLFLHTNVRAQAPLGGCSPPSNIHPRAIARVSLVNSRATRGSLCRASGDGQTLRLQRNLAPGSSVAFNFYIKSYPCWYAMEKRNCGGMVMGTFSPQKHNAKETFELNDAPASHHSSSGSGGSSSARSGGPATRSGVPCRCEPLPLGGLCLDELPDKPSACLIRECARGYRCTDAGRLNCQRIQKPSFLRCDGGRSGNRCNNCKRITQSFEVVQFLSA